MVFNEVHGLGQNVPCFQDVSSSSIPTACLGAVVWLSPRADYTSLADAIVMSLVYVRLHKVRTA